MEIGASSSCFYPLETEKAFKEICDLGFQCSEIFFNSYSELNPAFLKELKAIKDGYGIDVASVHPYASFSEGYDFFSRYERRFFDGVENYKRFFEAASFLGARFIVMHGSKGRIDVPKEEYAERYFKLSEKAREAGVTLTHENVVNFSGESPEFMAFMKKNLGESFKMVLDIKQARRAGVDPMEFLKIMGKNIVHVHLSDCSGEKDCLPPSENGLFDFKKLFSAFKNEGYKGKFIIELYSDSFKNKEEIKKSEEYLKNILQSVERER